MSTEGISLPHLENKAVRIHDIYVLWLECFAACLIQNYRNVLN